MTIAGEPQHVLDCAVAHAVSAHGHTDGPELRAQIRSLLVPEPDVYPGGVRPPKKLPDQPAAH